jgi:hypothetical protein
MIALPIDVRVWLAAGHTDMRRGMKYAIARVVGCQVEDRPVLVDWPAHQLLTHLRPALMAASAM